MGFFQIARKYSRIHQNILRNKELAEKDQNFFMESVRQSAQKQRQIEGCDTITFDEFLHDYFTQTLSNEKVAI